MTSLCGELFCDGGARGNPGPAGAGAALYDPQGNLLDTAQRYLGPATNNIAEYQGLLLGLELARKHKVVRLQIKLDSELVVKQLTGEYKVRHAGLLPLWQEVRQRLQQLQEWHMVSIPREKNTVADQLVNQAIDQSNPSGREGKKE